MMKEHLRRGHNVLWGVREGDLWGRMRRFGGVGYGLSLTALGLSLEACSNSDQLVTGEGGIGGDGTPVVSLASGSDTGISSVDLYTMDGRPTVNVLGPIDTVVVVKDSSGNTLGTGMTGSDGMASFVLTQNLQEGVNALSVETQGSFSRSSTDDLQVILDSSAQKLEVTSSVVNSDLLINAEELRSFGLRGANAEGKANFRVEFMGGGKALNEDVLSSSVLTSSGTLLDKVASTSSVYEWSFSGLDLRSLFDDVETMPDVAHGMTVDVVAYQTDLAGNVGEPSSTVTFTLDLIAPKPLATDSTLLTVESPFVAITFDEMLSGSFDANSFSLTAIRSNGIAFTIESGGVFAIDSVTMTKISFELKQDFGVSDNTNGWILSYDGSKGNLRDEAGNKVESFTLTHADGDFTTEGGDAGAGGTVLPEAGSLMLTLDESVESASGGRDMDSLTKDDTPSFVATWGQVDASKDAGLPLAERLKSLSLIDSRVILFRKEGVEEIELGSAYVNGSTEVTLTVGSFVDGENMMFTRDVSLEDGQYEIEFRIENSAPGSPATIATADVLDAEIDTKAPSIVLDSRGVVRTGEGTFEVRLSEKGYYDDEATLRNNIAGALAFAGSDFVSLSLGTGESFEVVSLSGQDVTAMTYEGFSFEIMGLTGATTSIVHRLATTASVSLLVAEGTLEDRAGNENKEIFSLSRYVDFRPPTGEDFGFSTNTLSISFDKDAEGVGVKAEDVASYTVTDKGGTVYTVTMAAFDGDINELVLTLSENVEGQELTVKIEEDVFKGEGDAWDNFNIEHDVTFDLRAVGSPTVDLVSSEDTGEKDDDNRTSVNKPEIEFMLDANDRGGTLMITIEGLTVDGERYEMKFADAFLASGGTYRLSTIPTLKDGTYDVKATITDKYGREGDVGYLTGVSGSADSLMYTLSGVDANKFETTGTDFTDYGVLSLTTTSGVSAGDVLMVTLVVTDGAGGENSREVEVTVEDTTGNRAPTFLSISSRVSALDGATDVGDFVASDGDGDPLTYTLRGEDAGDFSIDAAGMLSFATAADYSAPVDSDKDNTYEVTVVSSDGMAEAHQRVRVQVREEDNDAPLFDTALAGTASVTSGNRVVGTFAAMDSDDDSLEYSLGGVDQGRFSISRDGVLSFNDAPNQANPLSRALSNAYDIKILASDGKAKVSHNLTVTVSGTLVAPNKFPSISGGGGVSVEEGMLGDFMFAGSDGDAGDMLMYTLSGVDAGFFMVDVDTGDVMFITAPTYASPDDADKDNVYEFTVVVSDGKSDAFLQAMVSVTDMNEDPTITAPLVGTILSVVEGSVFVANVQAVDGDGDELMYDLEGTDGNSFSISPLGRLEFRVAPDLPEDKINYALKVVVSDGRGGDDSRDFAVQVTATDLTQPRFLVGTESLIVVNEGSDVAWRFRALDGADGKGTVMYTLEGADNGDFNLDTNTGILRFVSIPDFERPDDADGNNVYELTIKATDADSNEVSHAFLLTVQNVNELPNFESTDDPLMFTVREDETLVTTVGAGDSDGKSPPMLVVDTKAPELVSVTPVFAATGTNKLEVVFNEELDSRTGYAGFMFSTSAFTFDATMAAELSSDGRQLTLYFSPQLSATMIPEVFGLEYETSGSLGIKDVAGNLAKDFSQVIEVIAAPSVIDRSWKEGTGGVGDQLILTFNDNVVWLGGTLSIAPTLMSTGGSDILTEGVDYTFDLLGDMLTITFNDAGMQLPHEDVIELMFSANVFSADSTSGGTAPNSEFVEVFDTLAPIAPILDDPPDPVVAGDFNKDLYISDEESKGGPSMFLITGGSGVGVVATGSYIVLENGRTNDEVMVDVLRVSDDWEVTVTVTDFTALNLVHGDMVSVTAYNTDGTNNTASANMLDFTVDLEGPELATTNSVNALEGTNIVLVMFDEDLWTMPPDSGRFTVTLGTATTNVLDASMAPELLGNNVIKLYVMATIATGNDLKVTYTSGTGAVRDRAGNEADGFVNETAVVSSLPVVESVSVNRTTRVITITFIKDISEITTGGEMLGGEDFKLFNNKTAEITSSVQGTPTITGRDLTVTFNAVEFGRLDADGLHTLRLNAGVLEDALMPMGSNFETDIEFDISPPSAPVITLTNAADTGIAGDNYTNKNDNQLEWELTLTEDVDITFELQTSAGATLGTAIGAMLYMDGDEFDFSQFGITTSLTDGEYKVVATMTTDRFGNVLATDTIVDFTVDTTVVWDTVMAVGVVYLPRTAPTVNIILTSSPDAGMPLLDVYYVATMATETFNELGVTLNFARELKNIASVSYSVNVLNVGSPPTDGSGLTFETATLGAITDTSVAVTFMHTSNFASTYMAAGSTQRTFILFKLEDAAGNTVGDDLNVQYIQLDVAGNLDLAPPFLMFSPDTFTRKLLEFTSVETRGKQLTNPDDFSIELIASKTNWSDATDLRIWETRTSLDGSDTVLYMTPDATPISVGTTTFAPGSMYQHDFMYDVGVTHDADTIGSGDLYYQVEYRVELVNSMFTSGEGPATGTLIVDRVASDFKSALVHGGEMGGVVTVNNLYLLTRERNTADNGWTVRKDGSDDSVHTEGVVTVNGTIGTTALMATASTQYFDGDTDYLALSLGSFTTGTTGVSTMPSVMDGDVITFMVDYDETMGEYVGDIVGNGIDGHEFSFTYTAGMFYSPGDENPANLARTTIGNNLFPVTTTAPSIDDDFDLGLSVLGVEFIMDDEGLL